MFLIFILWVPSVLFSSEVSEEFYEQHMNASQSTVYNVVPRKIPSSSYKDLYRPECFVQVEWYAKGKGLLHSSQGACVSESDFLPSVIKVRLRLGSVLYNHYQIEEREPFYSQGYWVEELRMSGGHSRRLMFAHNPGLLDVSSRYKLNRVEGGFVFRYDYIRKNQKVSHEFRFHKDIGTELKYVHKKQVTESGVLRYCLAWSKVYGLSEAKFGTPDKCKFKIKKTYHLQKEEE